MDGIDMATQELANQNQKLVADVWFLGKYSNIPEETLDLLMV
jgi:hypothetical protein